MGRDDVELVLPPKKRTQFLEDFADEELLQGVELLRAVRFLGQRINEATSLWLSPYGVSATKFNYLAVLYVKRKEGGMTAGELGASVRTSSGSVTTMIDVLVREKLALRRAHPTDRRCVLIRLTARGERLYRVCAEAHHARVSEITGLLGVAKGQSLLKLLTEAGNAIATVADAERLDKAASAIDV